METLICSSKGCDAPAEFQVRWNNPKIHTPERRKVWLACSEHEPTLRSFLDARGFYRDTTGLDDDAADGTAEA
ncbi:hypothetical protein CLV56_3049 [Mumia flava]|uniref:Acetone carboxylase n=1 Tax=Mumia flava TaxID=1348852 RepID=A0A0B2B4L0_9ACTN|nr:hypothetical protein [Mumia flava]PJJ53559.1 hypothetical protein CLV56_3049 [Mumia flava]